MIKKREATLKYEAGGDEKHLFIFCLALNPIHKIARQVTKGSAKVTSSMLS